MFVVLVPLSKVSCGASWHQCIRTCRVSFICLFCSSGLESPLFDKDTHQLLMTCTTRLRVEHLSRLSRVREELSRRAALLTHRIAFLKDELSETVKDSTNVRKCAGELMERIALLEKKSHRLGERLDSVNKRASSMHYASKYFNMPLIPVT